MRKLLVAVCMGCLLVSCAPQVRYSPSEITKFPERIQENIKKGKIALGMTPQQVRYAWGAPNAVDLLGTDAGGSFVEEWIYAPIRIRGTKLVFTDGKLTGILTGVTKADSDDYTTRKPSSREISGSVERESAPVESGTEGDIIDDGEVLEE